MKTFNRFCWFAVLCFVLFFLAMAIVGCGAKKKLMQKSQFSTEVAKVEKISQAEKKETKIDISTLKVKRENNVSVQENFQGEVADSSKEATLTVENLNGKKVYRYTNFKNVRTSVKNSNKTTHDSLASDLSKIDKSETAKESKLELDAKASGSEKTINKEKEGKFPWWWLVVAVVIYGVVSYFRKTLNPLGWFSF